MAAGTVAYTDTTGNQDYLGMIAGQIGKRLKEASDMASNERAYAEGKAEDGGTSLSEAGIGKGYFFKRALGSRFGGDAIARTKGRMGMGGAGTDPTGNFRSRFRGGFDYNVTNEIQAANAPLSGAVVSGLRGVESGLIAVSQSITRMDATLGDLAELRLRATAVQAGIPEDKVKEGNDPGAPKDPMLRKKIVYTTLISAIISIVISIIKNEVF